MLCARVVRGINSTANEVTAVEATSFKVSRAPSGRRNPQESARAAAATNPLCPSCHLSRGRELAPRFRPQQKLQLGSPQSSRPSPNIRRPGSPPRHPRLPRSSPRSQPSPDSPAPLALAQRAVLRGNFRGVRRRSCANLNEKKKSPVINRFRCVLKRACHGNKSINSCALGKGLCFKPCVRIPSEHDHTVYTAPAFYPLFQECPPKPVGVPVPLIPSFHKSVLLHPAAAARVPSPARNSNPGRLL